MPCERWDAGRLSHDSRHRFFDLTRREVAEFIFRSQGAREQNLLELAFWAGASSCPLVRAANARLRLLDTSTDRRVHIREVDVAPVVHDRALRRMKSQ